MSHSDPGNRPERAEPHTLQLGKGLSGKGCLQCRGRPSVHGLGTSFLERSGFSPVGVAWWVGFIQWAGLPDLSRLLGSRGLPAPKLFSRVTLLASSSLANKCTACNGSPQLWGSRNVRRVGTLTENRGREREAEERGLVAGRRGGGRGKGHRQLTVEVQFLLIMGVATPFAVAGPVGTQRQPFTWRPQAPPTKPAPRAALLGPFRKKSSVPLLGSDFLLVLLASFRF